jgi:hypothetical protein
MSESEAGHREIINVCDKDRSKQTTVHTTLYIFKIISSLGYKLLTRQQPGKSGYNMRVFANLLSYVSEDRKQQC